MEEEKKEKLPFKQWFTDVFWYHYKWWFLAAVFAVALIVTITVEALGNTDYDFTVVFGINGTVSEEYMDEFISVIGDAVGDINGDGDVEIQILNVNLGDTENSSETTALGTTENYDENNQTRMLLYLMDEEYSLFIFDEDAAALYTASGYLEDRLEDYGIESESDNPYLVQINNTPLFERMGLDGINLYAAIMDWTTVGKGSQELTDAAVSVINAILNAN